MFGEKNENVECYVTRPFRIIDRPGDEPRVVEVGEKVTLAKEFAAQMFHANKVTLEAPKKKRGASKQKGETINPVD